MNVYPFPAIRPNSSVAMSVSCLPYDVMNRTEAARMAQGNPHSFLRVIRSEIDIDPSVSSYDSSVYAKASENLNQMIRAGTFIQDDTPCLYLYEQTLDNISQLGIVACFSIDDYLEGRIKKHELTRPEKEVDRIQHFDACHAHTEPVFLAHRSHEPLDNLLKSYSLSNEPAYSFRTDDQVLHRLWVIHQESEIHEIQRVFQSGIPHVYIADGHHRTASSVKIGLKRKEENPDISTDDPSQYIMAVSFPHSDLRIMEYNRVVTDLNGLEPDSFLEMLLQNFLCEPSAGHVKPKKKHTFGMFLNDQWYRLEALPHTYNGKDVINSLDVSILQRHILEPLLGISDPRTDQRIDFVGGIRGIHELEKRVHTDMTLAFSLFPTTMDDLMQVADENKIMPPKSTWFEPKLRSGLFVHSF